jgi:divalent metal cation (Fe/Co/Zn/Cd) transporter
LVAVLLIGGAIGIGSHSLSLLLSVLSETAAAVSPGPLQTALLNVTAAVHNIPAIGHSHAHAHALDLNAAWFAAASVVAKEWLFQITRKVAEEESSPVLMANAYHHRSDAYSSVVALVAILGSGWFPALPLDPLGGASRPNANSSFLCWLMFWIGLVVSIIILQQGLSIFKGAFWEMTDASAPESVIRSLSHSLDKLRENPGLAISFLHFHNLRARRAGSHLFVHVSVGVPGDLMASQLVQLEKQIVAALKAERKDVKEVQLQFKVTSEAHGLEE